MRQRRLTRFTRIAAEMGVIVFSVLLALGANEWRQAQARRATIATVHETIRAEIAANRAQVERALAHHRDMVEQLRTGGVVLTRLHLREAGIDTTSDAALARSLQAAARALGAPMPGEFRATRLPDGAWRVQHEEQTIRFEVRGDSGLVRGAGNIALMPPFLVESAWETAQITQAAVHMDPELVAALARIRQLHRQLGGTVDRLVDILYGTRGGGDLLAALQDLVMFETHTLAAYDLLLELL